jgi:hypothetical protein
LFFDIDRSHNVFILGLGRSRKKLSEDVQAKVTSDKPHEMITSHFRFIQRVPWRQFSVWKNQLSSHASQSGERRLTIKFAIAIRAVVSVLVRERFHMELSRGGHDDLGEKLLAVMVVELLDHPVSPRLSDRDKPEVDSVEQAEADEGSHASWMSRTSIEDHLVIDLDMVRDAHAPPNRPDSIQKVLA